MLVLFLIKLIDSKIDALQPMKLNDSHDKLDAYYQQVQGIILDRQDWVSGCLLYTSDAADE